MRQEVRTRRAPAPRWPLRRIAVAVLARSWSWPGSAAFALRRRSARGAAGRGRATAAALCDRPLDEVVLPATHNSMSAPLPGWYSAEQERPIRGQLDDGIRGLLLDTHYGDRLPSGRVRTVLRAARRSWREVIARTA